MLYFLVLQFPPLLSAIVGIVRALEGTVMTNSVKVMIKYRRFRLLWLEALGLRKLQSSVCVCVCAGE